jgi:hypothetical protein
MYRNVHYPVASFPEGPVRSPGVCSIKYFKWEDVLTWPTVDPQTGIIISTIVMKAGKYIYLCESVNPSRTFSENQKDSNAGTHFDILVKGTLSGSTAAHPLIIGTMKHHQWGLIVEDKNGVTRLIGSADAGADFVSDYSSGQGTDSRKTELSWQWQHSQPAPIYTAETFTIIIGGLIITAGCLKKLLQFKVGAAGAPMDDTDTDLTEAQFANKRLLILADGVGLPIDYGDGAIDWTGSIDRHVEKALAGSTAKFIGGVVNDETIEIYAWN